MNQQLKFCNKLYIFSDVTGGYISRANCDVESNIIVIVYVKYVALHIIGNMLTVKYKVKEKCISNIGTGKKSDSQILYRKRNWFSNIVTGNKFYSQKI